MGYTLTGVYTAGVQPPDRSAAYRLMLDRLRLARSEAGLTQVKVAEVLGRPQSFVSKIESGERRLDPIELNELAVLYGKDVPYFLPPR